jgi:PadR family transcriptional regulator AphA
LAPFDRHYRKAIVMDVKTLCLGALTLGDATGYEIRKLFEEGPFAHFYDAGYGSIYPALASLLEDGLVDVTEESHAGRPDRKIYSLTPAGRERFKQALALPPKPDRIRSEHVLRFFFADLMEPADIRRVYDDYLAHFEGMVKHMRSLDPQGIPPGRLFARGLGLSFYEAVAGYLRDARTQFESDVLAAGEKEAAQ